MKSQAKIFISLVVILILSSLTFAGSNDFVPGEAIFKTNHQILEGEELSGMITTGLLELDLLITDYKAYKIERTFPVVRPPKSNGTDLRTIYTLHFPKDINVREVSQSLKKLDFVQWAEPRFIYHPDMEYNDEHADNRGQYGLEMISAPQAHDLSTGDDSIIIAINDTGMDMNHRDLEGNVWINLGEDINNDGVLDGDDENGQDDDNNGMIDDFHGWDFMDDDNDPEDTQPSNENGGHGTHTAGIASAVTNNEIGVASIGYDCSLMIVRTGNGQEIRWGFDGIVYAVNAGADVVNCSWSGPNRSDAAEAVINYAYENDVLVVVSAGNNNRSDVYYPGGYDHSMAVASSDRNDRRSGFSNYGEWVAITAPGSSVYSTFLANRYMTKSGTSMSAPMVAGMAGLMKSVNPDLTVQELWDAITESADSDEFYEINDNYRGQLGAGRINAHAALLAVGAEAAPAIAVDPLLIEVSLEIGQQTRRSVTISNVGNAPLEFTTSIGRLRGPHTDWISIDPEEGQVAPGDDLRMWVNFETDGFEEDDYAVNLHILSNDEEDDDISVRVNLELIDPEGPPAIDVDPNAIEEEIGQGVSRDIPLTITNEGRSELVWNSEIVIPDNVQQGPRRDDVEGRLAIFQDTDAWGVMLSEQVLANIQGLDYQTPMSDRFGDFRIDDFDMIWVVHNEQGDIFNTRWNQNRERFEDWVDRGGVLYASTGANEYDVVPVHPGGLTYTPAGSQNGVVTVQGQNENAANYNYLADLMDWQAGTVLEGNSLFHVHYTVNDLERINNSRNYQVIVRNDGPDNDGGVHPGIVWYDYGNGHCIVSGTTDGHQHSRFENPPNWGSTGDELVYFMDYLANGINNNNDWLSMEPTEGRVPEGEEEEVTVTIDATGLAAGDHEAGIHILSNDPDNDDVEVAVTITVTAPDPPELVIDPDEVDVIIVPDDEGTYDINIANEGDIDLVFQAELLEVDDNLQFNRLEPSEVIPAPDFDTQLAVKNGTATAEQHRIWDNYFNNRNHGPARDREGGPDDFGYTWADSDEQEVEYTWVNAVNNQFDLDLSDDDLSGNIVLGFNFPFYGENYDRVRVCSNGWITFDSEYGGRDIRVPQIPSDAGVNNVIAVNNFDLNPSAGGGVYYMRSDDYFVVEWYRVPKYGVNNDLNTFEVVLFPDGTIRLNYGDVGNTGQYSNVGIENSDGSDGLSIIYEEANRLRDGYSIVITQPDEQQVDIDWASIDPAEGELEADENMDIELTLNTNGLEEQAYQAELYITSNDPRNREVIVPITMEVREPEPPEILVRPDDFELEIELGQVVEDEIRIYNRGEADLEWEIRVDGAQRGRVIEQRIPERVARTIDGSPFVDLLSNASDVSVDFEVQEQFFDWLEIDPVEGTVEANGRNEAIVRFGGEDVRNGIYEAEIHVLSNDDDERDIVIPVTLQIGEPDPPRIAIADEEVTTELEQRLNGEEQLLIANAGGSVLNVETSIDYGGGENGWLELNPEEFAIEPGDNLQVAFQFSAEELEPGEHTATTHFFSNDPDLADATVQAVLTVTPDQSPFIAIEPNVIESEIDAHSEASWDIQITNTGVRDLVWNAEVTIESGPGEDEIDRTARSLTSKGPRRDDPESRFAFFQDRSAWQVNLHDFILDIYEDLNAEEFRSASFDDFNIDEFDVIWIVHNAQVDIFNERYNESLERFEAWVDRGGILYASTGTIDFDVAPIHPGGIERNEESSENGLVVVQGEDSDAENYNYLCDLMNWRDQFILRGDNMFKASYDEADFNEIDNSSWHQVIIRLAVGDENPGVVAYRYGQGYCVVSGTKDGDLHRNWNEHPNWGAAAGELCTYLDRLAQTARWMTWEPHNGRLAEGESEPLTVTINANELADENLELTVTITSNDPDNGEQVVPVNVRVRAEDEVPDLRHFGDFTQTDVNQSLLVTGITLDDEPVPTGWEVGVFTPDDFLAGGVVWEHGEQVGFAAWGDDQATDEIDGFRGDELMIFKIWDFEADIEYETSVDYQAGPRTWTQNALTVFSLSATNLQHFDDFIQTDVNQSLLVSAVTFDEEPVPAGWEIGVFTPDDLLAGGIAWSGDEQVGFAAWGDDQGTQEIDGFRDGELMSFKIWDNQADIEYDAHANLQNGPRNWTQNALSVFSLHATSLQHFGNYLQTDVNQSLLLTGVEFDEEPVPTGWEVGVFTPAGVLAGAIVWEDGERLGFAAWGDDQATEEIDGFRDGELMHFRIWDFEADEEHHAQPVIEDGPGNWTVNALTVFSLSAHTEVELQHFTEFIQTDVNHSMLVFELLDENEELAEEGWEIGAFTPAGILSGAAVWERGEPTGLAIWGDEANTEEVEGFNANEPFRFRLWNPETETEYGASYDVLDGGEVWNANGFSVVRLAVMLERDLTVRLFEGWNMMSINVLPGEEYFEEGVEEGPDVILMTEQFRTDDGHLIDIFKNENGLFYTPAWGFNNIPYWDLTRGFQVKMVLEDDDEFVDAVWTGLPIDPDAEISLRQNWNIMAYFPDYELDMSAPDFYGVSPIIDVVEIMKNGDGLFILPEWNFSNMPPLTEGFGYQIKLSEATVFSYPAPQNQLAARTLESGDFPHWQKANTTGSNMSVLVNSISGIETEAGDQIAAINSSGEVVGTGIVNENGKAGVAVWGDDVTTQSMENLVDNEAYYLNYWSDADEKEYRLRTTTVLQGKGLVYEPDGFTAITAEARQIVPDEYSLSSAYPNPFNGVTRLSFGLPEASQVNISVYDLSGHLVASLVQGELAAGTHSASWNSDGTASGIYVIRLNSKQFNATRKVMLLK